MVEKIDAKPTVMVFLAEANGFADGTMNLR